MKARVNFITLAVGNLEKSKTFYQNAFGFSVSEQSESLCMFELNDGFFLVLAQREELQKQMNDQSLRGVSAGFILSHNADSEEQVEEIIRQAEQHGATRVKTLEEAWGYSVSMTDIDGHHWEIAYIANA